MPATDDFGTFGKTIDGPATGGEAVTPHNTNELTKVSRMLYIGAAGALAIVTEDGTDLIFAAVPAGTTIPVRAKQVKATGTVASSIVALW